MQTREQKYALEVYRKVDTRKGSFRSQEQKNKYGSMAHKLPILIRTAGLAQALEFVNTRDDAQKELLQDLAAVMEYSEDELMHRSREASIGEYVLLTEHALAALLWFKRFAQSVLDVTADASSEGATDD